MDNEAINLLLIKMPQSLFAITTLAITFISSAAWEKLRYSRINRANNEQARAFICLVSSLPCFLLPTGHINTILGKEYIKCLKEGLAQRFRVEIYELDPIEISAKKSFSLISEQRFSFEIREKFFSSLARIPEITSTIDYIVQAPPYNLQEDAKKHAKHAFYLAVSSFPIFFIFTILYLLHDIDWLALLSYMWFDIIKVEIFSFLIILGLSFIYYVSIFLIKQLIRHYFNL